MKNKIEESNIELFFDFLNEHINIGFNNRKREYTLEKYIEESGKNELPYIGNGYHLIFPIDGDDKDYDTFARLEVDGNAYKRYLNPKRQIECRKMISSSKLKYYSLFSDLNYLYDTEISKFHKNLSRMISSSSNSVDEQNLYVKRLITRIEYYRKEAKNPKFAVIDNENNDNKTFPLYDKLNNLIIDIKNWEINPNGKPQLIHSISKKPNKRTVEKVTRDLEMVILYIKLRQSSDDLRKIKQEVKNAIKTKDNKPTPHYTFMRAMRENKPKLKEANLLKDFGWDEDMKNAKNTI